MTNGETAAQAAQRGEDRPAPDDAPVTAAPTPRELEEEQEDAEEL